ncbi:hypothetical protein Sfum_1002 [Syntrophobacter fumaroxidans MPOB]|uniref:Uncharacterized protein n=1 Tax=Syntrophobacter fumaroxidans (strain DSM 10017 / MPOB) TaxID=335543 RepID=A0LGZ4_SYNFM|nr:hypothetical protein Sfum_1002 [Syntrophobacter fumaroxidans MPOB]
METAPPRRFYQQHRQTARAYFRDSFDASGTLRRRGRGEVSRGGSTVSRASTPSAQLTGGFAL